MRITAAVLCFIPLILFFGMLLRNEESWKSPQSRSDLNSYILKAVSEYPLDGSYKYIPPKDPAMNGMGVTKDLFYQGQLVATGDPQKRSHCIGWVFEVFLTAQDLAAADGHAKFLIGDGSKETFKIFQKSFYGSDGNMGTFVEALSHFNLGTEIKNHDEVKPGDLIQVWRMGGSGHAGIFKQWETDTSGTKTHITYYQSGVKGIGIMTDSLDRRDGAIRPNGLYLARAYLLN